MKPISLLFVLGSLIVGPALRAQVETYPAPPRAVASAAYRVTVAGQPVFTEHLMNVSCAQFSFDGSVTIQVQASAPVTKVAISPKSAGVVAEISGSTVQFTLDRPRFLVVTINENEKLFIFADPIDHAAPQPGQPGVVNVRHLGIDATGEQVETVRLQQAIDQTAAAHGVLYFPPGVYLTGSLHLPSNLTLYLTGGAVLLGSTNLADYPRTPILINYHPDKKADPEPQFALGTDVADCQLILIDHAENVRIAGRGAIDGQGKIVSSAGLRPNLVLARSSSHLTIEGVALRNPAHYNNLVLACDHVTYQGMKIFSDRTVPNTDGIDPDGSSDVLVDRCFLCSGDDSISIKTSGNHLLLRDAERITISNSVFISKVSLVKIGNESYVDIRDVTFRNNDLLEAPRVIDLSSMDGGRFENFRFIDTRVEHLGGGNAPISLLFHLRSRPVHERPGWGRMGWIHNILVRNLTIDDDRLTPSRIEGFSERSDVSGIHFENLRIGQHLCLSAADAGIRIGNFVHDVTFTADGTSQ